MPLRYAAPPTGDTGRHWSAAGCSDSIGSMTSEAAPRPDDGIRDDGILGDGIGDGGDGLDPADWDAFRALAHRMLDDSLDHIVGRREEPVWRPMPDAVRARLRRPAAPRARGARGGLRGLPSTRSCPTRWATTTRASGAGTWAPATPWATSPTSSPACSTPTWAAATTPPCSSSSRSSAGAPRRPASPRPPAACSSRGASEANLVGLAVARTARLGPTVRERRPAGRTTLRRLRLHRGPQLPPQVRRAARSRRVVAAAGPGHGTTGRWTSTPSRPRSPPTGLPGSSRSPSSRRRARSTPGRSTTSRRWPTSPRREGLWFHVDGAIGGFLGLSTAADAVRGIERADSLALDLHKWMQAPIDVGLALVRDEAAHRATFSVVPHYLSHATRGLAGGTSGSTSTASPSPAVSGRCGCGWRSRRTAPTRSAG